LKTTNIYIFSFNQNPKFRKKIYHSSVSNVSVIKKAEEQSREYLSFRSYV